MKIWNGLAAIFAALLLTSTTFGQAPVKIGGKDVVKLERKATGDGKRAEFLSATVLPGRGMNLVQVTAFIPGKGVTNVLYAPPIEEVAKLLNGGADDQFGNGSFKLGAAFLVPFANLIRGKASANRKSITAEWEDKQLTLPANWPEGHPEVPPSAIHGLIRSDKADSVTLHTVEDGEALVGVIHAGDFGGAWPSKTDLEITITLTGNSVTASVNAKNVGDQKEPMGIGWHPYFAIPSGNRKQAKLSLPATKVGGVNDADDGLPTGKWLEAKHTPRDFNMPGGKALGDIPLDDYFGGLVRKDGAVVVELTDPAAHYGIRILGPSQEILNMVVYAPADKPFVAAEEQFNVGDPFGKQWKGQNTGMVTLQPGQSVTWTNQLELFTPKQ